MSSLLGTPVTDQDHYCIKIWQRYKTISVHLILIIHFSIEGLQGLYPNCRDHWKGTIVKMYLFLQKAADTQKEQIKGL